MRSTLRFVLTSLLFTAVIACGKAAKKADTTKAFNLKDFPNVAGSIYGGWTATDHPKDVDGVSYTLRLYFNDKGEIAYAQTCERLTESLEVAVTIKGAITATNFQVPIDSQAATAGAGSLKTCVVNIQKATWAYQIHGNSVTVQNTNGGTPLTFDRIQGI